MCSIIVDRTGFPLIPFEQLRLDVHLLPVTKLQFERFLASPNEFGDTWCTNVLRINGRASWRSFREGNREQLFLTGILPEEAASFAAWLGAGFRLPTVVEWQAIHAHWFRSKRDWNSIAGFLDRADRQVRQLVRALLQGRHSASLAELAHLRRGVMEWASSRRGWRLLGQPREAFCSQLFDCQTAVTPTDPMKRHRAYGFRLVRPAESPK